MANAKKQIAAMDTTAIGRRTTPPLRSNTGMRAPIPKSGVMFRATNDIGYSQPWAQETYVQSTSKMAMAISQRFTIRRSKVEQHYKKGVRSLGTPAKTRNCSTLLFP